MTQIRFELPESAAYAADHEGPLERYEYPGDAIAEAIRHRADVQFSG